VPGGPDGGVATQLEVIVRMLDYDEDSVMTQILDAAYHDDNMRRPSVKRKSRHANMGISPGTCSQQQRS
jgi:hypothetical protein